MNGFDVKLPCNKLTKEMLIADLKRVSKKIETTQIKYNDIKLHSNYSITSYRNHFGTLRNALEAAGLCSSRNWGTSEKEYLENIKNVWEFYGKQPAMSEMNKHPSKHSSSSYIHFFGSWTEALKRFINYINDEPLTVQINYNTNNIPQKHQTSRNPNWRLRFLVLKRDNFTCKACGKSPAKDRDIELHVDHIIPWSKGGETVFDNLQTLCSQCNIGKSNIE